MQNSNIFDYINVLDRAADASWLRNQAISNNIANATTPGYKRQDVSFEKELRRALGNSKYESMDSKVYNLNPNDINPRVYTDAADYSYRMDGNNVDIDTENVYLAENQIKYNALIDSMNKEFKNLASVMK
ncbi:MAG: flagellar basal body rod protein FlgB [Lachnospiraceae bacterium]|nr:flagellar basal body rod protein FlgB [Lachnospiraceae bacterium]